MAQPPDYNPASLSQKNWDANLRAAIDTELSSIKAVLDVVRTNLDAIQRDDTKLENASVHLDALTTEVLDEIGAGVITSDEVKTLYEANTNTNAFTDADQSKLSGIETGATADQTGAEIKTAYEAEADTNAFTDAEQSKLTGIESGATADQTDAEIETAYNTRVAAASQAEAEAGTEAAIRRFSPLRIAQAIAALETGGGSGDLWSDPLDSDIIPDTDATYDLGSDAARFAEAHLNLLALTGTSVNAINDEDDMVSDAADALATQQSIKAYADNVRYVTESGTAFTVGATHKNRMVRCTAATEVTITVSTGLGAGFNAGFLQEGDGQLVFAASGTTLNKPGNSRLKSAEKNAPVFLHTPGSDVFFVSGELQSAAVQTFAWQIIEADTDCAVADGAGGTRFFVPDELNGFEIVGVQGHVVTAGTTGTMDVQLHNVTQAVDILTDKLQFASGAKASDDGETVNTSNNALTANDEIRADIDAIHTTAAKGLFLALRLQLPA